MNQKFKIDFDIQGHEAHTLNPACIGTHEDGWTIEGQIHDDYYKWVNYFEASHPTHGRVWGDFERTVFATSKEAYNHFIEHHFPESWDYWDI